MVNYPKLLYYKYILIWLNNFLLFNENAQVMRATYKEKLQIVTIFSYGFS